METLPTDALELKHGECLSLLEYSTETWLCHDVSGERLRLAPGKWVLHIHPETGFGALEGNCGDEAVVSWANGLLQVAVYTRPESPQSGQWLQFSDGKILELSQLASQSVCRVVSFQGLHGEEVHMRLYGHKLLTGKCMWAFALTLVIGFLWGASSSQRGWIAKRVGSWHSRSLMLGAQ
eukprot:96286-Amphidinium_carterae.1